MSFQKEKKLVLDFYEAIETSELNNTKDVFQNIVQKTYSGEGFTHLTKLMIVKQFVSSFGHLLNPASLV